MTKREAEGRFLIEFWKDAEGDPADQWDSNDSAEVLLKEAARVLAPGAGYKYAILYEWNYSTKEWDEKRHLTPQDFA